MFWHWLGKEWPYIFYFGFVVPVIAWVVFTSTPRRPKPPKNRRESD